MTGLNKVSNENATVYETKHIYNNETKKNIIIEFDNIKNKNSIDIKLTNRGENKASGLTYDIMFNKNGFFDLYNSGLFIDVTKNKKGEDEFTYIDKINFAQKLSEIHKTKGYKVNFDKMKIDETFTYTFDEYLELASAAGYKLKNENDINKLKVDLGLIIEEKEPEVAENQETKTSTVKEKVKLSLKEEQANSFYDVASLEDLQATLNSKPELKNLKPREQLEVLKNLEQNINLEIYNIENYKTIHTKKFLFWGGNEKVVKKSNEDVLTIEEQMRIDGLKAQLYELKFLQKYVEKIVVDKNWSGYFSPHGKYNNEGNVLEENPTYRKVIVEDENSNIIRALQVKKYIKDEHGKMITEPVYEYYKPTVRIVGNPLWKGQPPHPEVVVDKNAKLVNAKLL